jgi:hypothetical protein
MPSAATSFKKRLAWLLISLAIGFNSPAVAQDRFFLQTETGQGLFFAPGLDPYTFSAQIHPALGFGENQKSFMVSGSLAAVYNNPDWAFMWGGRLVLQVAELKKKPINRGPRVVYATLHLVGAMLMESAELRRVSGGFSLDIWEGALLIGPRVGYDRKTERTFLEIGLGMGF